MKATRTPASSAKSRSDPRLTHTLKRPVANALCRPPPPVTLERNPDRLLHTGAQKRGMLGAVHRASDDTHDIRSRRPSGTMTRQVSHTPKGGRGNVQANRNTCAVAPRLSLHLPRTYGEHHPVLDSYLTLPNTTMAKTGAA